jgi:F-type H+-transporting ATPase subunit b
MFKRAERIAGQILTAEQGMAEANRMKLEYEEKLKEIEVERTAIMTAARSDAAERNRQLLEEGKREVAALKERAAVDIQNERGRLKDEISEQILELSVLMAGKFVTQAMDRSTQERMFEEAIAGLEDASWLS